ncbi:putative Heterokaryon incompatibility domain-containing protein [Seiridium unicorne]|uniref:Heterokaryon incompatibility domain-containing protein n=1 Tax=Seiridium unicorne TaxID=138068 RepID=A0ABR2UFM9_9PEZI
MFDEATYGFRATTFDCDIGRSLGHTAEWESFLETDAPRVWSKGLQETIMLLAAMISCQMPMSALGRARERFVPVIAPHEHDVFLCLLSKHAAGSDISSGQGMYIVSLHASRQAHGQDLVLTDVDNIVPTGLVSDFLNTDRTNSSYFNYVGSIRRHGYPKNVRELKSVVR